MQHMNNFSLQNLLHLQDDFNNSLKQMISTNNYAIKIYQLIDKTFFK